MGLKIQGPAPKNWAGCSFTIANAGTGTALDLDNPDAVACKVHSWTHDLSNPNQVWVLEIADFYANTWTIQATRTGYFLELRDGNTAQGADIIIRPRLTDVKRHDQEWYLHLVQGASSWPALAIQNVASGTFVNLKSSSPVSGTPIWGWPWDESNACTWKLHQQVGKKL